VQGTLYRACTQKGGFNGCFASPTTPSPSGGEIDFIDAENRDHSVSVPKTGFFRLSLSPGTYSIQVTLAGQSAGTGTLPSPGTATVRRGEYVTLHLVAEPYIP
jgi:hypothetical protein